MVFCDSYTVVQPMPEPMMSSLHPSLTDRQTQLRIWQFWVR